MGITASLECGCVGFWAMNDHRYYTTELLTNQGVERIIMPENQVLISYVLPYSRTLP